MSIIRPPRGGLTVSHDSSKLTDNTGKELQHVIQLDLVENVTKDILRSIRNNEQVKLKLGKKPIMQYGRKQLSLNHNSNTFPSELFFGPIDGSEPLYFSGKLSHTLEVQNAKKATAKSDDALANLENTLKSMKEQQASNEASFMGKKKEPKKKDVLLPARDHLRRGATPSSPFLATSPRLAPTSNPLLSLAPSKDKIRQDAMRISLVHLLAIRPLTPKAVAQKLRAPQTDCDKVLEKVARDGNGGMKELKEKCFRELDVWKFRYSSEEDRKTAIERAIHAYDRMRIDKNDPIWQQLLPKEERNKGTILSKLNFAPLAPTPKIGPDTEGKAEASDRETKAKKAKPPTVSKDLTHKKRLSGDNTLKKRTDKNLPKTSSHVNKPDAKYKSAERIEDSDEEAEDVDVIPAKAKAPKAKERDQQPSASSKLGSHAPSNDQHKSKLSNASSSSSDLDRSRLHEDRTRLKPQIKHERSPTASRISPHPRNDSSPQKPSPLGSSPPTNSTDLEDSSKSSVQSSAPSSPPSSTDMPLSQRQKNYSPVIAGKGRNGVNLPKRKAEKGDDPAPKRQQIHGLGLTKSLTEKLQQPTPGRRSSDSCTSSPEKAEVTKDSVIDATLKFREYYAKYKDLHIKLTHQDSGDRSDRDLYQLWRMHERLEKIKSELWSDWAKVGGEMPLVN